MKKEAKEEPLYKKIIGYVVSILCLLLCLYITIEVINANTHHRPPSIMGISISYVPTESMEPVIHAGDFIMSRRTNFDKVKEKDIVVYYNEKEDKYIVHRVIQKDEVNEYLIVKGDNNPIADDVEVTPNMIYSKYVTTVGFLSIFSGGINQNAIFFILVGIFVVMLAMQLFSVFIKGKTQDIKKENEEKKEILREELRRQILAEELAKLKAENEKKDTESSGDKSE